MHECNNVSKARGRGELQGGIGGFICFQLISERQFFLRPLIYFFLKKELDGRELKIFFFCREKKPKLARGFFPFILQVPDE